MAHVFPFSLGYNAQLVVEGRAMNHMLFVRALKVCQNDKDVK